MRAFSSEKAVSERCSSSSSFFTPPLYTGGDSTGLPFPVEADALVNNFIVTSTCYA
ncbi:hypothetical protein ZHAS_00018854 [Anopheles sinensis]|uniref:Uncharacterized protein n=1 Tax=Anopheles sinensis TaxID=74873 RepID=A0A084WKQ8_ANOSI|nr:hypothetical protein ZHAS_00018854 [Anopheles sinensis]